MKTGKINMNAKLRSTHVDGASADGFTLAELLVILAVLALLVLVLFPALANTQTDSRNFRCLNNQKQIMQAWRMYAEDNADFLPPNDYPYTTPFSTSANQNQLKCWAVGTMEQPIDVATPSILVAPQSLLSAYITNVTTYKCPADEYIDSRIARLQPRSVSMNSAVGTLWYGSTAGAGTAAPGTPVGGEWLGGAFFNAGQTTWLTYGRLSSIIRPSPANLWVVMDENPYSINDSSMATAAGTTASGGYLVNFPSGNHNGAAGIAFADGHSIIHRWLDPGDTCNPQKFGIMPGGLGGQGGSFQVSTDQDCLYLAQITSAAR